MSKQVKCHRAKGTQREWSPDAGQPYDKCAKVAQTEGRPLRQMVNYLLDYDVLILRRGAVVLP